MPITTRNVTTLRRSVNTALLSCAVVATAAFIPVSANASTTFTEKVTTKVDVRDLETDYGIQRVYKNLTRKAEASCGAHSTVSLAARSAYKNCAAVLLTSFIDDLDHDGLTAYHQAKVTPA